VKIGDVLSDWSQLSAGVPQGSYLGPLMFIIVIDALQPGCLTHKYVDDTTMTEFLSRSAVSSMQLFVDELVQQATDVGMIVNGRKTKELLIGSVVKDPPPPVNLSGTLVERVTTFKLLGVHVASDLKWTQHIDAITSKAASRLHFLKQLKRSGDSDSTGVRLSCVALQSHRCTDEGSGVAAAQSDAGHFPGQRLHDVAHQGRTRNAGVTSRPADRTIFPAQFPAGDAMPPLSAPGLRHPRNFETLKSRNAKFQNHFIFNSFSLG